MLSFIKEATVRAEEDSPSLVNGTETSIARVLGYISLPGMLRFIRYSQAAWGHLSRQPGRFWDSCFSDQKANTNLFGSLKAPSAPSSLLFFIIRSCFSPDWNALLIPSSSSNLPCHCYNLCCTLTISLPLPRWPLEPSLQLCCRCASQKSPKVLLAGFLILKVRNVMPGSQPVKLVGTEVISPMG